jgi:phospholipid/cholesterol/gamma-HCH transport system permease protein
MRAWLEGVGKGVSDAITFAGGAAILLGRTLFWIPVPPLRLRRTLDQMSKIGVESLPIVTITNFFIGVVIAFQSAYQMKKVSAEIYIPSLVSISICREIAPVITGLVVAGRIGAAIAAEIGSMKVTEQVDALETLAANPVKYLVVPRFLALVFMLPLLTCFADIIGIAGGYTVSVYKLGLPSSLYIKMSFDPLMLKDILTGLAKTMIFGVIIAVVSCYQGLRVRGGAEGVGAATTRAVVLSFILIIVADAVSTVIFYFTT